MGKTYFFFGKISKAVATAEGMREDLIDSLNVDRSQLDQANKMLRSKNLDKDPSAALGIDAPARYKGDDFHVVDSHVNGHGDVVHEIVRKNESGRMETLRIREARTSEHGRVVAEVFGIRS